MYLVIGERIGEEKERIGKDRRKTGSNFFYDHLT